MRYISETGVYQLELLLGMVELLFSLGSIYFVYRWGVTLLSVGEEIRGVMIGSPFNEWLGSDDFLVFAASAYLGFKFVLVIVQTARWELSMEASRRRIYASHILNGVASSKTIRKSAVTTETRRPFT